MQETRIYDNRYFQRKEPRPTTEDREVENMHTDFKAKLPKGLQHVVSIFTLHGIKTSNICTQTSKLPKGLQHVVTILIGKKKLMQET